MLSLENILIPTLILGGIGVVFGIALAIVSKVFEVQEDERIPLVVEALPGANCGGCGYPGCAALADAIVRGDANVGACPVGGAKTALAVAKIMGIDNVNTTRMRAQVMCSGTTEYARKKYIYEGAKDCISAAKLAGGDKTCAFGCIGLGTCEKKCKFDAIKIVDGVAVVDYYKCTSCGMCVTSCPKKIIKLIPFDSTHWVGCMSKDKGPVVRKCCDVGCIGCKLCEKVCEFDAIKVSDNCAVIDYSKCTDCGKCVTKCPRNIIWSAKTQGKNGLVINRKLIDENK